jgi:glyoxylase-like metal-dependent hydrolase (beta-lactamase superfamily II)
MIALEEKRTAPLKPIVVGSFLLALACCAGPIAPVEKITQVTESLSVIHDGVNGALIHKNGKTLAIYGDPWEVEADADMVLFTHHRRDAVWAGRDLVEKGAVSVVPAGEADLFTNVRSFWQEFVKGRFHDYEQQTTKVLIEPLRVDRIVRGGDQITWEGLPIKVLDTPGYTRGSVTYLTDLDGKKVAFTGDLVYGDGRLLDLYSLQDSIPEICRGYHGYGARSAQLIESLKRIADEKPDLLIPARGPIITEVEETLERLISRLRAVYKNYLEISAYSWYSEKPKAEQMAVRVLGPSPQVNWMQSTKTDVQDLPEWIVPIRNSRLILSQDGSGFLIDCGSQAIINQLIGLRDSGQLSSIDGVYISHYHDDHTDQLAALIDEFSCPVYASAELQDVLEHPGSYRLPAMTSHPIKSLKPMQDGAQIKWEEFEFTFNYFPGQTIYHGALTVRKTGGEQICFVGDSLTPTGIDDYCPQNRNFLHPGMGYLRCFEFLRRLDPETRLINQHVKPMFRFSPEQLDQMEQNLKTRIDLLEELFPWGNANFGLDEGWARFYPYGLSTKAGEPAEQELRIWNHLDRELQGEIRLNPPAGWTIRPKTATFRIGPGQEGTVGFELKSPGEAAEGAYVLTADVDFNGWQLREWTEGLVVIEGR